MTTLPSNGSASPMKDKAQVHRERRYSALRQSLTEVRELLQNSVITVGNQIPPSVNNKQTAYQQLIFRLRKTVSDTLPSQATVLVAAKGDSELLKLDGRIGWHFPQSEDGRYAGYHPPDSEAAIQHLEQLREKGAEFLVFPSTAFWWFDFYGDFRKHLEHHYAVVVSDPTICCIFRLRRHGAASPENECKSLTLRIPVAAPSNPADLCSQEATIINESDLRIELAASLSRLGRINEACNILLEGIQHDAENPQLWIELAKREYERGDRDSASHSAAHALKLAKDDCDWNLKVAQVFIGWQRFGEAESNLCRLIDLYPADARAVQELAGLYCLLLETGAHSTSKEVREKLLALIANSANFRMLTPKLQLRITECMEAIGEFEAALKSLRSAVRRLGIADTSVRDFVQRLLCPAVSDPALIPFREPRSLAALLTQMGNGFAAIQSHWKAVACYQLAASTSTEARAAELNLAFIAMRWGNVPLALQYLSKSSRIYSEDAHQVCWPSQDGQLWPHCQFDLSAAFESLKPADVSWPKISVITPSYNQAAYVEETVLSILNQHYPALEYIVVDGGSTDGAVEVLRRYESKITKLIVEPDDGQTDAINKGLRLSTGELLLWLNSDDMLAPGALFMLALAYLNERADVIAGFCFEHSSRSFNLVNLPAVTPNTFNTASLGDFFEYWLKGHYFYQPEVAFSRRILDRAGGELDKTLDFTMDYDLWLRCAKAGGQVTVVRWPVGLFRRHDAQKTANLDHTIIEQGRVRDRYVVPQPRLARRLDIRRRLLEAFARRTPRISVISTRAGKIFSPDTARELRQQFAAKGLNVTFYGNVEDEAFTNADLVILLVHIYNERAALRKLREAGCDVPVVGWFWDNHHHVFENFKAASDLDICIPGHAFAASYLRSTGYLTTEPVPLCVTQWTAAEAGEFFERHGSQRRSDELYGGFVRYSMAAKRNALVERLIEQGMEGVYFLEEHDLSRYFGLTLEQRFATWASHKVSLCLPLDGDVSQRLFDALVTGQIPLVPRDVYDLDTIIPRELQDTLPIVRFDRYDPDHVLQACSTALALFDTAADRGIRLRHTFALDHHMFATRLGSIFKELDTSERH